MPVAGTCRNQWVFERNGSLYEHFQFSRRGEPRHVPAGAGAMIHTSTMDIA